MKKIITNLLLVICFISNNIKAQCSGGTNGGALTPAPTAAFQTKAVTNGNYYTFTVPASACPPIYVFSFCSADGGSSTDADTQITILDNTGAYAGGYNDDNCGTLSRLTWSPTSTLSATYRVLVNKYTCVAGGAGVLAYKVTNSYTNTTEYTVNGNASSTGSCTTLTPNTTGQTGCIWDVNSTLNFLAGFTYDFIVNLGASDAGADGMAFVIQNDPRGRCACGSNGGSLAAGGITNSLIVEIDTYMNTEDRDDFVSPLIGCAGTEDPDHIDLWINGVVNPDLDGNCNAVAAGERPVITNAVRLQNPPGTNYNIENGLNHILRVTWVPGTPGTFTARILNTALTTTYGIVSTTLNPIATFGTNTPFFGATASTGGLSNQQSFCNTPVLLPVELISFNADCISTGINITWSTASEQNNKQFDILRSIDGINFIKIGTVSGNGNTSSITNYSFLDNTIINDDIYYYKLQQVDFSGFSKTYNLVNSSSMSCLESTNNINVYPNPTSEYVNIDIGTVQVSSIEVYSSNGQLIYFLEPKAKTIHNFTVNTSLYAKGIYLFKINTNYKTITKKININ